MNRRQFLALTGASTIGASSLGLVSASADKTKIVTDRAGNEPIRTKEVPTKWLDFENRVSNVRHDIADSYRDVAHTIAIVNSDERIDDLYKSKVQVSIDPDTMKSLSSTHTSRDSINGVQIDIKKEEDNAEPEGPVQTTMSCNTDPFDPVPGGVNIDNLTSTCKVWDHNGNPGLMTAAHGYGGGNCEDPVGKPVHQAGVKIGEITMAKHRQDWAFVEASSNISGFANYIAGEGSGYAAFEVAGHKTQYGLRQMKSSQATAYKMGAASCLTNGRITGVDVIKYLNCYSTQWAVQLSTKAIGGDSGAPHFDRWTDPSDGKKKASIICPHWGGSGIEYGVAAYRINDEYNISFAP